MTLRLVFMGTPDFALPSLAAIMASPHEIIRVYTQPPRPGGRGHRMIKSAVHTQSLEMGLTVSTPAFFSNTERHELAALRIDAACVVAYGQILPEPVLNTPRYGCLNLHASLLPRWRGAAPVQRAIMAGDTQTGVQIIQMCAGLDKGDILRSETQPITNTDTGGSLSVRLAQAGAHLWPQVLSALEHSSLAPRPQSGQPCYAHKIDKAQARLNFTRPAPELERQIRALNPNPYAWCFIGERRVKIYHGASGTEPLPINPPPGTCLNSERPHRLCIACGNKSVLEILELAPAGKTRMSGAEFLRGQSPSTNLKAH